ncbi:SEC-C motif domain protein [Microbacterium sp. HM58-2]|nr:SEC-C motif domain protein [Microbacterium sp. HM58-2]
MSITVIPRPHEPGYADIELHDGRRITWDLTIPEAEKLADQFRACGHEPGNYHGDGSGGWLCDACGALVETDAEVGRRP